MRLNAPDFYNLKRKHRLLVGWVYFRHVGGQKPTRRQPKFVLLTVKVADIFLENKFRKLSGK